MEFDVPKADLTVFHAECTGCLALNGNKIKHITKTKVDIKFYTSSFSMVTLPVLFLLDQCHLLGTCMQHQTPEFCLALFQFKRCFP